MTTNTGIPDKNTGDTFTAAEFNLMNNAINNFSGGAYPFPPMPTPLTNEGHINTASKVFPHDGTAVNSMEVPGTFNATQDFHGRLDNAIVWSVFPTNINAACDGFLYGQLCWYDNVNDRLWVFPYDVSPTTLHTAYITLETGAVTYVGSAVLSAGPNSYSTQGYGSVHRDAVSSGNFTIQTHTQTYVISDSDGSEVSYTSGVTNGKVGYVTSDGSASLYIVALGDSDANRGYIEARKDGKAVRIPTPIGLLGWMGSNSRNLHFIPWGDKVKVVSVTTAQYMKATFDRAEFDQWVQDLLKYGGVE